MNTCISQTNTNLKPHSSTKEIRCSYIMTLCQLSRLESKNTHAELAPRKVWSICGYECVEWTNGESKSSIILSCTSGFQRLLHQSTTKLMKMAALEKGRASSSDCWLGWAWAMRCWVLDQWVLKGAQEYLVKWLGYNKLTAHVGATEVSFGQIWAGGCSPASVSRQSSIIWVKQSSKRTAKV